MFFAIPHKFTHTYTYLKFFHCGRFHRIKVLTSTLSYSPTCLFLPPFNFSRLQFLWCEWNLCIAMRVKWKEFQHHHIMFKDHTLIWQFSLPTNFSSFPFIHSVCLKSEVTKWIWIRKGGKRNFYFIILYWRGRPLTIVCSFDSKIIRYNYVNFLIYFLLPNKYFFVIFC